MLSFSVSGIEHTSFDIKNQKKRRNEKKKQTLEIRSHIEQTGLASV